MTQYTILRDPDYPDKAIVTNSVGNIISNGWINEEEAEFIVTACNTHKGLVETLSKLYGKVIGRRLALLHKGDIDPELEEWENEIEAALKGAL